MTHPRARPAQLQREARRAHIAALLLAGVTDQRTIANQLGISKSTVSHDIKILEQQWREQSVADIAVQKGLDLARVERLISAVWSDAIKGDRFAIDRVISLMQHRSRLLGLDAPQKREETVRITVNQIAAEIAEQTGLRPEEIIAEAERILAAAQGGAE